MPSLPLPSEVLKKSFKIKRFLPESQGQHLAFAVSHVAYSLDSEIRPFAPLVHGMLKRVLFRLTEPGLSVLIIDTPNVDKFVPHNRESIF